MQRRVRVQIPDGKTVSGAVNDMVERDRQSPPPIDRRKCRDTESRSVGTHDEACATGALSSARTHNAGVGPPLHYPSSRRPPALLSAMSPHQRMYCNLPPPFPAPGFVAN